ncbi:MAG: acetyl-CoA acetyltransferase [Gammaproteobacteria bacterium RIFCSPHIGHO2_12_FULL_40_19]|nr:MAG: acetyl-CoA acetyltransferase [Gammaproteobacteria bacterium RIFCSPHIGHO2_12_FULL_40_19]
MQEDPIVIVSAKRTPIGNFNGIFKDIPTPQLGSYAIAAAFENMPEHKDKVDAVYMGCVLSAGLGQAPARQAALAADLSVSVPCTTVNKMCGSGMQSVMQAYHDIQSDHAKMIVAGGMENMSRAPYLLQGARTGLRMGPQTLEDHMLLDGLVNAYGEHLSMGVLAEQCAKEFHITRDHQDAYAVVSINRAIDATKAGVFKTEITSVSLSDKKGNIITIDTDEGIQKVNLEKMPLLKPAFTKDGTITAANSSSISDGAAALILMRLSYATSLGIKPLAKIIADTAIAQVPELFSTAPIAAIEKLLKKAQWAIDTVDLFEINEAFAVVTLAAMKALSLPFDKINIHGGACVLGHPIGASGARILVTLIHALKHYDKKRGIAALCIGGGEATAMAIEMM